MIETVETGIEVNRKRVWGGWATAGFGLVVLIASIAVQVIVLVIFFIGLITSGGLEGNPASLTESLKEIGGLIAAVTTIPSAIISLILIIAFIKMRKGACIKEYLGLTPISLKTVLIVLAISAGYIILSEGLAQIIKPTATDFTFDLYRTSVWPPLLWIAVIIFAPAFEEAFFRGFLFEGFRQSRIGIIGAIGITTVVWTLLHIQYSAFEIGAIFVQGLILGMVRWKTGSLWSVLAMHAFHNAAVTVLIALSI
ncbi:lysostaphin resistance A-like protein [Chloroflexota bacterium]